LVTISPSNAVKVAIGSLSTSVIATRLAVGANGAVPVIMLTNSLFERRPWRPSAITRPSRSTVILSASAATSLSR